MKRISQFNRMCQQSAAERCTKQGVRAIARQVGAVSYWRDEATVHFLDAAGRQVWEATLGEIKSLGAIPFRSMFTA